MFNSRVSTSYQYARYTSDIHMTQRTMLELQNQVVSGKKFTNLRDDPHGASTVMQMRSLQSRYDQFDKNLLNADQYLGLTDQALSDLTNIVSSASTLALQGSSATIEPNARQTMANEVEQLQRRLELIGNQQGSGDKYIFAGQDLNTKPFTATAGVLTFNGDNNPVEVEIRSNDRLQINLPNGGALFTELYTELESLKTRLTSGDSSALETSIADLKTKANSITTSRGDIATKLQSVEILKAENDRRIDELTTEISNVQDVDLAETLTKYKNAEVAYQSALQVLTQGTKYSLLDFIR
jgi:flagellar hook-associated protein 3 FlgL